MSKQKQTPLKQVPIIFTRGQVLLPIDEVTNIDAGRDATVQAINVAFEQDDKYLIVTAQKTYSTQEPEFEDVFAVGTIVKIVERQQRNAYITIEVLPIARVHISNAILTENEGWKADIEILEEVHLDAEEEKALANDLISLLEDSSKINYKAPSETVNKMLSGALTPSELADYIGAYVINSTEQKQVILEQLDVIKRLQTVLDFLTGSKQQDTVRSIASSLSKKVKEEANEDRLEEDDDDDDLDTTEEILNKLNNNPYPKEIKRRVKKEMRRLGGNDNDRSRALDYIDWLLKVPYWQKSEDNNDIENVKKVLDEDHYGLKEPKERIVEYIAVKKMTNDSHTPIICFYGEPGTGKTSLAKSIARALNRKLVKSSLGGVDDEAKIRGFLRTYVGASPGMIIKEMTKAGTINPVFVLDEVDKLSSSAQGDPSSALLEVLDPEQNNEFVDHYIEEPYDLSNVMFIATANYVENIPPALQDRMELIYLPPYTEDEKINIALNHLIPNQIKAHGLESYEIEFSRDAVIEIISHYTLEAGVRGLDKKIAMILRKLSVEILTDKKPTFKLGVDEVRAYLGDELVRSNRKQTEDKIGVVTGMAVVGGVGGDILPIEVTTQVPGSGQVSVTGNLKDMMKESGAIAMAHVRSFARNYGIDPRIFDEINIHIHFPDAAPKDGNSAGVAMAVGIVSALTGRKVNKDVAMTGEVSLMGNALMIGGVREKATGALRAGIKKVLVPRQNEIDLKKLPEEVTKGLEIVLIDKVSDAVELALTDEVVVNNDIIELTTNIKNGKEKGNRARLA